MGRRILFGAAAAMIVLGVPATALAGGGCHGGLTEADATGESDATITMVDACFDASVLRVDPGTDVTFANEDPLVHDVGGTGWGSGGDLRQGDVFTARFADPGVYPFACSYHQGMTGAVVVGDGKGAGAGWTVLNDPVGPGSEERSTTAVVDDASAGGSLPLVGIGLLGAVFGALAALGAGRLRRAAG
jgi:plastocyanin